MKHFTIDEWRQYVRNQINENLRDEFERHLYMCDQCLDYYLQAVEENESSLPIISSEGNFTDLVMGEVTKAKQLRVAASKKSKSQPKTNAKKPFYQQAVFHYLLAAVATLMLTFTGAFHSLAVFAGTVETPHFQEKRPSVTEGVINKTFTWMNSLEKKEANKK
jgi:predicted anti-sigma-YlaC factor YlaD